MESRGGRASEGPIRLTSRSSVRTLRFHLRRAFAQFMVVLGLAALVAMASIIGSARTIDDLSERIQPLLETNSLTLQYLTDAQAELRGYGQGRHAEFAEAFDQAIENFRRQALRLSELAEVDPDVERLAAEELRRADDWLGQHAIPSIERLRTDPEVADPPDPVDGAPLFEAFRVANAEARTAILERRASARQRARNTSLFGGLVLATLVAVLIGIAAFIARRLSNLVASPLESLGQTLSRLAEGDLSARATVDGPTEIQAVAVAVNELADSRQRSQLVQDEALTRMQELDQARADFVSSVSHELRTPLTSVTGYSEMLLDGDAGELTEQQSKMVTTIERNARRLLALVEDILTVSRLEAGEHPMASEPIDVAGLVHAAAEAVRPSVRARSLDFDIEAPPQLGTIRGDHHQLERVLLNLLSNAVKFTPKGGRISISTARHHDQVTIVVTDTGLGIPAAEQPRMFERFFRSSISRDEVIPGTGLGLTIVKSIVEAHGGTIDFHSTPGRGTTFTVNLPVIGRSS